MTLYVLERGLLVAEETRHGRIASAMGHALGAVDEDGLCLDDDVLLSGNSLVLEILQRVLRLVQLLLQRIADPHQLVTFAHQTVNHIINTTACYTIQSVTRNSCTGRSPVRSIGHARSCRRRVAAYWIEQTLRSQNCKYLP